MSRRRLTERQKARIQTIQNKRREAATARADSRLGAVTVEAACNGLVITRHGNNLLVEDRQRELNRCLFRQNLGHVVCGDEVVWQPTGDHEGVVTAIRPRRSILSRPDFNGHEKALAANITQIVIVIAPQPAPAGYLLDQYLVTAANIDVQVVIAVNKADLVQRHGAPDELAHVLDIYPGIGYPLIQISAREPGGLQPLFDHLRDQTSILVGQSGVGKSSLVNACVPDLDVQTSRLSEKTGHGRHTTSSTSLYHLPFNGRLIDSPGVRSFRLGRIDRQTLERGFIEFRESLGACRFSDCTHTHEPGCALREAVEAGRIHPTRLNNLIHMAKNL